MTTVSDYTALLSGSYWNGIEATGTPVIVTYSFPTSAPSYDSSVSGFTAATVASFQAFNDDEQKQARNALAEWAAASGITFVEVAPGKGDINFQLVDLSTSSYGSPGGIGFYPFGNWDYSTFPSFSSDLDASGDVFMNSQDATSGTVNYGTLLHEIGHAIGLKHPTEIVYSPTTEHDQVLDTGDDPTRTIMATVGDSSNADPHLLQLDKDADAFIYGASGGQVVSSTTTVTTGANSVSSWSWDPGAQTLTQTAVTSGETIRGSSVTDVITAMSGDNRLFGLNGNDTLTTGSGNDYLDGGPGADIMTGGDGNDTYIVDDPGDQVIEQANQGYDIVNAYVSYTLPANVEQIQLFGANLTATGNDLGNTMYGDGTTPSTLNGMGGNDYIVAGRNNDTLNGGIGNDSLYGGSGNDTLIAGTGIDTLNGGTGFDTADYSADTAPLTIDLGAGTASSTTESDTLVSIEHAIGGSGNDIITAGPGTPFNQPDLVKSSGTQNNSADLAVDLDGSFRIKSDPSVANSATIPHATVDATSAGESEYYIFSVVDPGDTVTISAASTGGAFTPLVSVYDEARNLLTSGSTNLSYTFSTPGEYVIEVQAAGGNPIPSGDAYTLQVSLTNEVNEWLEGGAGNDTLYANTGWERLDGGAGTDLVAFNRLGFGVNANLATGIATGSNGNYTLIGIENLTGTKYADTLTGDGNANVLNDGGAGGSDTMTGGAGDDSYYVNNSGDTIVEAVNGGYDHVYSSVSYTLSPNIEALMLTGTASTNGTGNNQGDAITGNTGSNVLTGGTGNDVINDGGAGGADTMIGGAGNDTYYVNNSGDTITEAVGGGTDQVLSSVSYTLGANIEKLTLLGTANLSATANNQGDTIVTNSGVDTITGGTGNDLYYVNNSGDTISEAVGGGTDQVISSVSYALGANIEKLTLLGSANLSATANNQGDTIVTNSGVDTITGGTGNDLYDVNNSADTIVEAANGGNDKVYSTVSYTLGANLEELTLVGTANLSATANNQGDILISNSGVDTLTGGTGADSFYIYNSGDTIAEAANGGYDHVYSTVSYTLGANLEALALLGTGNINGTGNNLGDGITGNTGSNVLTGGTGNDIINDGGAGGADTMIGGAGNDTYYVNNSGDTITEAVGGGTDQVLSSVSYTLGANIEKLTLLGTANLSATANNQGDTIITNSGVNTIIGGSGNDTYYVTNSGDTITEAAGGGTDQVFSTVSYTLGANIEKLTLQGSANLIATANNQGDTIVGNTGVDTLTGGTGNDSYYVYNSADTIAEAANGGYDHVYSTVNYTLGTNLESLTLLGTANVNGTGNSLSNVLTGNSGNNVLDGKGGIDTLVGGGGNDTFLFDTAIGGTSLATMSDFSVANDMIDLDRTIFSQIAGDGTLSASAFGSGTTATNAATRILYDSATGDIYYDPDGNGSQAAIKFAHVAAGTALTAANFQGIG